MATNLNEVYKCSVCGNIVTVIHASTGELACCNQPMALMKENTVDASIEKHVPVIEMTEAGILVKVGEIEHPMEDDHYIEWIEILADGERHIKYLNPGDGPEALFPVQAESVIAREYCNLHGLWKA